MEWYKSNPVRFEMEKRLLARFHPGVKIIIEKGEMRVIMKFRARKATYFIEGFFPRDFPNSPLDVYVREPRLKSSPHQYSRGRLCLHDDDDVGPETTAKIYMDWTKQWIATYERWLEGIPWPKTNSRR